MEKGRSSPLLLHPRKMHRFTQSRLLTPVGLSLLALVVIYFCTGLEADDDQAFGAPAQPRPLRERIDYKIKELVFQSPSQPQPWIDSAVPFAEASPRSADLLYLDALQTGVTDPEWIQTHDWEPEKQNLSDTILGQLERQRTCLTFEERYNPYEVPIPAKTPVPPTRTRVAFLYRIRANLLHHPMRADIVRDVRATIVEVQLATGMDVYLYTNLAEGDTDEAALLEKVEPEFRDRVVVFDWNKAISKYLPGTFRDVVWDNHFGVNHFLEMPIGRQYNYVWWREEDLRSTGSYASMFNFINASIPRTMPEPYSWELRNSSIQSDSPELMTGGATDNTSLSQDQTPWQPDLILTRLLEGVVHKEEFTAGPGNACEGFMPIGDMAKAFIMLTGMSRKMHEQMVHYYGSGHSCFCEYFTSSVAKRHRVPTFVASLPRHINPTLTGGDITTWAEPRPFAADPYYKQWKDRKEICRPGPAVLHKVYV